MGQQYEALKARLGEITDLRAVSGILSWDQETYMPPAAAQSRGEQQATLGRIGHEMFISAQTAKLLRLAAKENGADKDSDEAAIVRVTQRDYKRERKLPSEFVGEVARAQAQAQPAWVEARAKSEFTIFQPHLEKMFGLMRRAADYIGYKEHPYDALLDRYEPDMKASQVKAVFDNLREETVPLVHAIAAQSASVNSDCLRGHFPKDTQEAFARRVIEQFGYDFSRGRLDYTPHPFCSSFSRDDVRITTRAEEDNLTMLLFSVLHEAGHALYDQGISPVFERTPLADGASVSIHESQSRMWENLVGRSREFWSHFYPALQAAFPDTFRAVSLDEFHRAINKVSPSFIRIQADELTYNLHIMLRFELEMALLDGSLQVADLPDAWNEKMQSYLGITPPDDAHGVLQDMHWAAGLVGYFPTYTLGNITSVQLFEAAGKAIPALKQNIAEGKFDGLLGWLRENIHQYGRKYTPGELVKRATGHKLSAAPYERYLKRKFSKIYGV